MILVDSSVWIDYFSGTVTAQTDLLHDLLGQELVVIGDLILTEVLQGFRLERDFRKARQLLGTLILKEMLGKHMAVKSAQNHRKLRRKGVTVRKTIDIIIATFCIENKLPLLHSDKDFQPMVKHVGLHSVI